MPIIFSFDPETQNSFSLTKIYLVNWHIRSSDDSCNICYYSGSHLMITLVQRETDYNNRLIIINE
jgi:hypothetical protein